MKYLVIDICEGEVNWISRCKNMRGAQASLRYQQALTALDDRVHVFKIVSVDEILAWESRGADELEALYKL